MESGASVPTKGNRACGDPTVGAHHIVGQKTLLAQP
jgi:hypothetical protein